MSLLDHNEQYVLERSMRLENEHEIEQKIRQLACDYLQGRDRELSLYSRQPPPTRTNLILQTGHAPTAGFTAAGAPYSATMDAHYIELHLDVAPGIQGFAAQIIAEEQLREQLAAIDTTP